MRIKHWQGTDGKTHYQLNKDDVNNLASSIVNKLLDDGIIIHVAEDVIYQTIIDSIENEIDCDYWNWN